MNTRIDTHETREPVIFIKIDTVNDASGLEKESLNKTASCLLEAILEHCVQNLSNTPVRILMREILRTPKSPELYSRQEDL